MAQTPKLAQISQNLPSEIHTQFTVLHNLQTVHHLLYPDFWMNKVCVYIFRKIFF